MLQCDDVQASYSFHKSCHANSIVQGKKTTTKHSWSAGFDWKEQYIEFIQKGKIQMLSVEGID